MPSDSQLGRLSAGVSLLEARLPRSVIIPSAQCSALLIIWEIDCATFAKSWERTAIALQAISLQYDKHANTDLLHTHELLKETSEPQARHAALVDLHNAALLTYSTIDSPEGAKQKPNDRTSQSVCQAMSPLHMLTLSVRCTARDYPIRSRTIDRIDCIALRNRSQCNVRRTSCLPHRATARLPACR